MIASGGGRIGDDERRRQHINHGVVRHGEKELMPSRLHGPGRLKPITVLIGRCDLGPIGRLQLD